VAVVEDPTRATRTVDAPAAVAAPAAGARRQDRALRAADVAIAGAVLTLTLPVTAAIAAAVKLADRGPVLYRGTRLGRGGAPFRMYKFRTLRVGAERRLAGLYGDELQQAAAAESTRVGRFLRPAQLDELPQLWNVLTGEMSLVGPRPLRPQFYEELARQVPNLWQRFAVRPGLTGLAQVRRDNVTPWSEKLAHDLEYVADRSLGLYARCCAETTLRVARQTGSGLLRPLRRRT
jgi:lipopolysaccharide/colanic/teichoic acid biosynthesis glycosyltransferase